MKKLLRFCMILGLILLPVLSYGNIKVVMFRIDPWHTNVIDLPTIATFMHQYDVVALYTEDRFGYMKESELPTKIMPYLGTLWKRLPILKIGNQQYSNNLIMGVFYQPKKCAIISYGQAPGGSRTDHFVKFTVQSFVEEDFGLMCDFILVDESVPGASLYSVRAMRNLVPRIGSGIWARPTYVMGPFPTDNPVEYFDNGLNIADAIPQDLISYISPYNKNDGYAVSHIIFNLAGGQRIANAGVSDYFDKQYKEISLYKPIYVNFGMDTSLDLGFGRHEELDPKLHNYPDSTEKDSESLDLAVEQLKEVK